jgi:hypothetical protein
MVIPLSAKGENEMCSLNIGAFQASSHPNRIDPTSSFTPPLYKTMKVSLSALMGVAAYHLPDVICSYFDHWLVSLPCHTFDIKPRLGLRLMEQFSKEHLQTSYEVAHHLDYYAKAGAVKKVSLSHFSELFSKEFSEDFSTFSSDKFLQTAEKNRWNENVFFEEAAKAWISGQCHNFYLKNNQKTFQGSEQTTQKEEEIFNALWANFADQLEELIKAHVKEALGDFEREQKLATQGNSLSHQAQDSFKLCLNAATHLEAGAHLENGDEIDALRINITIHPSDKLEALIKREVEKNLRLFEKEWRLNTPCNSLILKAFPDQTQTRMDIRVCIEQTIDLKDRDVMDALLINVSFAASEDIFSENAWLQSPLPKLEKPTCKVSDPCHDSYVKNNQKAAQESEQNSHQEDKIFNELWVNFANKSEELIKQGVEAALIQVKIEQLKTRFNSLILKANPHQAQNLLKICIEQAIDSKDKDILEALLNIPCFQEQRIILDQMKKSFNSFLTQSIKRQFLEGVNLLVKSPLYESKKIKNQTGLKKEILKALKKANIKSQDLPTDLKRLINNKENLKTNSKKTQQVNTDQKKESLEAMGNSFMAAYKRKDIKAVKLIINSPRFKEVDSTKYYLALKSFIEWNYNPQINEERELGLSSQGEYELIIDLLLKHPQFHKLSEKLMRKIFRLAITYYDSKVVKKVIESPVFTENYDAFHIEGSLRETSVDRQLIFKTLVNASEVKVKDKLEFLEYLCLTQDKQAVSDILNALPSKLLDDEYELFYNVLIYSIRHTFISGMELFVSSSLFNKDKLEEYPDLKEKLVRTLREQAEKLPESLKKLFSEYI